MKITVVIPVYNAAEFLSRAVHSALEQTEVKEILLIDDASKDDSLKVAQTLSEQFPQIKIVQHPDRSNQGAGASRNLGLKKARMDYIAFLDADDWYLPERFKITKKQFSKFPDALGIYEAIGTHYSNEQHRKTYLEKIKGQSLTTISNDIPPKDLFETLLLGKKGWWHLNGFTIKRTLLQQTGFFDESLRQSQDLDFILKASLSNCLYAGQLHTPVAIRGIHGKNRIFEQSVATNYKRQLYQKWFLKMLAANWSKKSNRFLLNTNLSHHPWIASRSSKWGRRLLKVPLLFYYFAKHPRLLRKVF